MSTFNPLQDVVELAKKSQYYSANDTATFEKYYGISSMAHHANLVRMVRRSLEWAYSQSSMVNMGDGDFLFDDFSVDDFFTIEAIYTEIEFEGIDLITNYLYALCGSYTQRVNIINGVFSIQFNNAFN